MSTCLGTAVTALVLFVVLWHHVHRHVTWRCHGRIPSQGESRGFGYACSDDGLSWQKGVNVATPGGTRTPFGLLPMTEAEKAARKADVLRAGVITPAQFDATNTSLQWLFYTGGHLGGGNHPAEPHGLGVSGWEGFHASIVQLSW